MCCASCRCRKSPFSPQSSSLLVSTSLLNLLPSVENNELFVDVRFVAGSSLLCSSGLAPTTTQPGASPRPSFLGLTTIMRLSFAISLLWFSSVITALNPCYFPDGTPSSDVLCPSSERCCPSGSTCMSNGLCQDVNNHNNDGTVNGNLNGAAFNSTGLYEAGTCQSTGNCDIISCPNRKLNELTAQSSNLPC